MTFWIAVGSLCGICGILAVLLVIADRYLNNYGSCKITINGEKEITVDGGESLLSALVNQKIFIPSACGGQSTCGMCKLRVPEGSDMVLPTEEPHLSKEELENNVRLSCQVKVREDMRIEIPEELFNVKEYDATVATIIDQTHDIKEFRFKLNEPDSIKFTPGQYVQIKTPKYGKGTEEVYRAYSLSSNANETDHIELVIRLVPGGMCTTYCFEHLDEGDKVVFNGPYGEFRLTDTDAPMIFIAGGSGMAPMKSLLHQMVDEGIDRECTFFFGANRPHELFYNDLMKEFENKLPRFKYVPVISRPAEDDNWNGETGLVTEAVARAIPDTSAHEAYLCGSPGMIDASAVVLIKGGMPAEKIFYDKFA